MRSLSGRLVVVVSVVTVPPTQTFAQLANTPPPEPYVIWKAEFDVAYNERGMFILTMHPHVIGHRARMAVLGRLVTYMKSKPGDLPRTNSSRGM